MKKIIGVLVISIFVGTGAFAQTTAPDLGKLPGAFQSFASDVATSLPFASTIGLNWSWAYIGKLPHLGAGLAAGAVFLPADGFDAVASAVGLPGLGSLLPELNNPQLGLPLPAYTAEARLGGIFLPFDVGVKVGLIPQQYKSQVSSLLNGMNVDFKLIGAEVRYDLVKEKILIPAISVGVGVNYFTGSIGMPLSTINFGTYTDPLGNTYQVTLANPDLYFNWKSTSLDAKIQISKKILLLVTPYIGAGLSYGISSAGGGLDSQVQINGVTPSSQQLQNLQDALTLSGQTINLTGTNFAFTSAANGFTARAFGGVSVNLLFLKIDGTLMYNVMTRKVGATVGARIQF